MAVEFIGHTAYAGDGTGLTSIALPPGTAAGDLVVLAAATQGSFYDIGDSRLTRVTPNAYTGYPEFDCQWGRLEDDLSPISPISSTFGATVTLVLIYRDAAGLTGSFEGRWSAAGDPQVTAETGYEQAISILLTRDGMPGYPDGYIPDAIAAPGGYLLNFSVSHWDSGSAAPAAPFTTSGASSWRTRTFAVSGGPPAIRRYPRDDGQGLSAAPRLHPLPRSIDRRIVGGIQ